MEWSDFTKSNIKLFTKFKYNIDNNSILLKKLKNEKSRIKTFIQKYQTIDLQLIKINNNDLYKFNKKIYKYMNTDWVDKKGISNEIDDMKINYYYSWHSLVDNIEPTLNYIYIKTNNENNKYMNKKIKMIIYIIEYLKHKNHQINKPVKMYLLLTNLEKQFPLKGNMNIENANTGYTDFRENIIFIWRKEELEKVIFHEIIHYLDMDHKFENINHIVNINGPHSYQEAITDVWGIFYHLIYLSFLLKKPIKTLLEIELGFIKNQAMYLNDYIKLYNWNSCPVKSNASCKKSTDLLKSSIIINQTTPAFSYYILKYLIFQYLLNNDIVEYNKYNDLLVKIVNNGFEQTKFHKIKSSRMTLLQIK